MGPGEGRKKHHYVLTGILEGEAVEEEMKLGAGLGDGDSAGDRDVGRAGKGFQMTGCALCPCDVVLERGVGGPTPHP